MELIYNTVYQQCHIYDIILKGNNMKKLIPSIHDIQNSFEKVSDQVNKTNNDKLLTDIKTRTKEYSKQAQKRFESSEKTIKKIKNVILDNKNTQNNTGKKDNISDLSTDERIESLMTYLRGSYDVESGTYR